MFGWSSVVEKHYILIGYFASNRTRIVKAFDLFWRCRYSRNEIYWKSWAFCIFVPIYSLQPSWSTAYPYTVLWQKNVWYLWLFPLRVQLHDHFNKKIKLCLPNRVVCVLAICMLCVENDTLTREVINVVVMIWKCFLHYWPLVIGNH